MDTRNGDTYTYDSKESALAAGVPDRAIAEVRGSKQAIGRLRMACRQANARRKAKRRMQKASRRGNR